MANKTTLYLSTPARLSATELALKIKTKQTVDYIPLTELAAIIINAKHCYLSSTAIKNCSTNNINIVICDQKLLPCSFLVNTSTQSNWLVNSKNIQKLSANEKQIFWCAIVSAKLKNQAGLLDAIGKTEAASFIRTRLQELTFANSLQIEATSARRYWRDLWHIPINRSLKTFPNNFFNYAYAIVRSTIAQQLTSNLINLDQGIFHKNKENSFNLVYDLIEPFRPLIDAYILRNFLQDDLDKQIILDKGRKYLLTKVLAEKVMVLGRTYPLLEASSLLVSSFKEAICFEKQELVVPEILI